jgi:heme a synthase
MIEATSTLAGSVQAAPVDWRLQIPDPHRRPIRVWLWSVAIMTFLVMVIGGITRLTQSGLSIVDWQPIMGILPPLSDAQWHETFDRYRQFPEYQVLRRGMTLDEFKFIFFWEYLHRMAARAIGIVFLIPFVYFWARGHLTKPLATRTLLLFALGAMQGVMGWFMVMSGLVERPSVSHYRLAAHLSLAFVIFAYALWLVRDLSVGVRRAVAGGDTIRLMRRGLAVLGTLLAIQIVWGAFVAGLKAGLYFNTFPLMGGRLVPANLLGLEPALLNFVHNPIAVQWTHRVIGTVLGFAAFAFFIRVLRAGADRVSQRLNATLLAAIVMQYVLGVLTLIYLVPVALGVVHQGMAMIVFGVWLWWLHHVHNLDVDPDTAGIGPTRSATP